MKKSLFGYGLTTKAIAKSGGWDIFDDKFEGVKFDEFGNILRHSSEFDPNLSYLEIPSPGIPPFNEIIKKSCNLISEYDYFLGSKDEFNKSFGSTNKISPKSVWISGTNGKTTTSKMTQHLLENYGSELGGNVGTPLAELNLNAKLWILETSSFTIHYTKFAKPDIYALLPITNDHLSWHGSFSEYQKAKLKPLSMMKEGSIAIIPEIYATTPSLAKIISYKDEADLANKFGLNLNQICFKTPFLMDAVLAMSIAKIVSNSQNYELMNSFVIEANKLEEIFDKHSRLWVNDTKATNIDACIQALNRYKSQKIHLILGGDAKGVDLEPIFGVLDKLSVEIYTIGEAQDEILNLSTKYNLIAHKCDELSTAVNLISKSLKKDEVALLSPACASLDQFKSYAHRGEVFKQSINKLD